MRGRGQSSGPSAGRESCSRALQQGRLWPTLGIKTSLWKFILLKIHHLICAETVSSCVCVKRACYTDLIACARRAVSTLTPTPSFSAYIQHTFAFVLVSCRCCSMLQTGGRGVQIGGLHFKHLTDHDHAAGGLCNTRLQWSHLTQQRRRLQVGRGLISHWVIS